MSQTIYLNESLHGFDLLRSPVILKAMSYRVYRCRYCGMIGKRCGESEVLMVFPKTDTQFLNCDGIYRTKKLRKI